MLKNYFKIAVRNLFKYRIYSFINIFGLAIGMACCMLIFLLVRHEWSFDTFHEKAGRIYRLVIQETHPDGSIDFRELQPPALYEPLLQEFPGVVRATRYVSGNVTFVREDRFFREKLNEVDSTFFQMFTFPLRAGDRNSVLRDRTSIVISEAMAKKHFRIENGRYDQALGQSLEMTKGDERIHFVITGVMADMPQNSSFEMDFLISFENYGTIRLGGNDWGSRNSLYLELTETQTPEALEEALIPFAKTQLAERIEDRTNAGYLADSQNALLLKLQPLGNLHLNPEIDTAYERPVHNPLYSYILSGIAALVLLIACINFMTLSIGRSTSRAREVGMRKVLGAHKQQLMKQFWGEALLMSLLAMGVGYILAFSSLEVFNEMAGKAFQISHLFEGSTPISFVAIAVLAALVAGMYPTLVLSRFQPAAALKGDVKTGGATVFTRSLLVMQYVLAVTFMIGAGLMAQQMDFIKNTDLGYQSDHVIVVNMGRTGSRELVNRFRNEVKPFHQVKKVVATAFSFTHEHHRMSWTNAEGVKRSASATGIDYDYLDILEMELAAGRNFTKRITTDPKSSVLVNEALVKSFGIENPLGYKLTGWASRFMTEAPTIIGVVKDFHFQSLHHAVQPTVLTMHPDYYGSLDAMMVKIAPQDISGTLELLEEKWHAVAPNTPFRYSFLKEDVARQYAEDEQWGKIAIYASVFAIVIACLGLFGLASLTVIKRTKEVGIRKVLGASLTNIVTLILKEFVLLVALSALLACPLAFYGMKKWLENFEFRMAIGPEMFILASGLAVAVAAVTLSYQAIKASLTNPVKTLKYE